MTDDAFERWCFVDDGSTFEEWLELDERRQTAERMDREFWANMAPLMLNAAQGPSQLALMAQQQQSASAQSLPNYAQLQQNALQGPLARAGLGHVLGGLGGLFGGSWS